VTDRDPRSSTPAVARSVETLAPFTIVVLRCGERYLLLHRAASKRLSPNQWTGVGGHVEGDELADLRASVLRELAEEAGVQADQVERLTLRRVLMVTGPGGPITVLLYYTGVLAAPILVDCAEGTLHWVPEVEMAGLDLIGSTRLVMPALLADERRDPEGREDVRLGATRYRGDGSIDQPAWV
jgi:8-oxo-dGTP diphosphatase